MQQLTDQTEALVAERSRLQQAIIDAKNIRSEADREKVRLGYAIQVYERKMKEVWFRYTMRRYQRKIERSKMEIQECIETSEAQTKLIESLEGEQEQAWIYTDAEKQLICDVAKDLVQLLEAIEKDGLKTRIVKNLVGFFVYLPMFLLGILLIEIVWFSRSHG